MPRYEIGSSSVANSPAIHEWQELLDSALVALLFAALLTAMVQSSSVVTGLAVISVQQGLIAPEVAVWLVAGSNVGTTTTALMASAAMNAAARKLAVLNTCFKLLGVLLFATLMQPLIAFILELHIDADQQVAIVHTVFNVVTAIVALLVMPHMWPPINRWLNKDLVTQS